MVLSFSFQDITNPEGESSEPSLYFGFGQFLAKDVNTTETTTGVGGGGQLPLLKDSVVENTNLHSEKHATLIYAL